MGMPERGASLPPETLGPAGRKPVERVPIEELPVPEREKIDLLETSTDLAYEYRAEVADFYRRNRRYLPVVMENDKRNVMRLSEILEKKDEGVDLATLLPWRKIDEAIEQDPSRTALQKQLRKKWVRRELVQDLERALQAQEELSKLKFVKPLFEGSTQESEDINAYYRSRWKEFGAAKLDLDEITAQAQELLDLQDIAKSDTQFVAHPEDLIDLEREYRQALKQADEIVETNPEAYYVARSRLLLVAKDTYDRGLRIAETRYVRQKINRITQLLQNGRPVFIHGELGAGKTELAKHLAETRLSQLHLARWEAAHPQPKGRAELKQWEAQRAREAQALLVSGHRAIEIEEIMASRKIEKKPSQPPEEQLKSVEAAWQRFAESTRQRATEEDWSGEFLQEKLKEIRPQFEQLYLEGLRNPIETKPVLGPFLRAMREGRPIILDEMNAIPHHVLIILNDYLTRQSGDIITPPFPDMEPFEVLPGFTV